MSQKFPCTECGRCCQNVHLSSETNFLDRGDGTCIHFAESTKHCSIYLERPDICRVDVQFERRFMHFYSWEEYVQKNLQVCDLLAGNKIPFEIQ